MLNNLEEIMTKENFGMYRDDGLAVVEGGGPQVERIKKKIIQLFKAHDLKITIDGNYKVVDFLDVVMDLSTASFKPFPKPNATIRYVSTMSNHPPSNLKNLPENINRRLSSISSGDEEFKMEADKYQRALEECGHRHKLLYNVQPPQFQRMDQEGRRTRQRKVVWFNPP